MTPFELVLDRAYEARARERNMTDEMSDERSDATLAVAYTKPTTIDEIIAKAVFLVTLCDDELPFDEALKALSASLVVDLCLLKQRLSSS